MSAFLIIKDLTVGVRGSDNLILDHIFLDVPQNTVLGLVGESGSGKTTIGLSMLGLLPQAMEVRAGEVFYNEKRILSSTCCDTFSLRGKEISMVFQEPLSAFDPVMRIGDQIREMICVHESLSHRVAQVKVLDLLALTGAPDPKRVAASYPHELSGGLRQRAMIAQAISCSPSVLIADEPTSNLDVTLQAKMMNVFRDLQKEFQLTLVLISHDLGLVRRMADEIVFLKDGHVVEKSLASHLGELKEDYSKCLLAAEEY